MRTAIANGSEDRCVEIRPEQSNFRARCRPPDRQGRAHRATTEHRDHELETYSGNEATGSCPATSAWVGPALGGERGDAQLAGCERQAAVGPRHRPGVR
jgi:hypothetical protein